MIDLIGIFLESVTNRETSGSSSSISISECQNPPPIPKRLFCLWHILYTRKANNNPSICSLQMEFAVFHEYHNIKTSAFHLTQSIVSKGDAKCPKK
jgi:hypothetical protein